MARLFARPAEQQKETAGRTHRKDEEPDDVRVCFFHLPHGKDITSPPPWDRPSEQKPGLSPDFEGPPDFQAAEKNAHKTFFPLEKKYFSSSDSHFFGLRKKSASLERTPPAPGKAPGRYAQASPAAPPAQRNVKKKYLIPAAAEKDVRRACTWPSPNPYRTPSFTGEETALRLSSII